MKALKFFGSVCASLCFLILFPLAGMGQTLDIPSGIQTYSSLTDTTVNMTGRSELHITVPGNPIPGCQINLNSSDAWFFLENVRPSAVLSRYLGQIQVNGAAAVDGSNVRVVEYAMGTVVIPHSPGYLPMEVFDGTQFTGSSLQLGLYTYYNDTNLGALYHAISSFTLKRGYMATVAQQPNGRGISRVYVAQDGDIEVSALPADLNASIGFVRVFPWHWTGKKGWAGGSSPVDPLWHYDWDNVAVSSPDVEYVPMRHDRYWNAYANINNKQGSTQALGFNEPDSASQANMTVAQAIAEWPNLMTSGLRLGSPAPTDGGLNWLYNFIDQADALHYRVDYVAVHFYRCGQTGAQLVSWLRGIHERTGRPVWVTEFNNGATWTTCAVPTLNQNAQVIGDFINAMENAPFVERYAIYNWVGATRAMVDSSGALTPAGVVYHDRVSRNSYLQELPAGTGTEANYLFNGDAQDSTGNGNDAMLVGAPSFTTGQFDGPAIQLDGIHDYIQLPANLGHSADFSFAAWVNWDGGAIWQRIFDLGNGTGRYMFLTPRSASNTLRFAITTNGTASEQRIDSSQLTPGVWTHVAVTISGTTGKLYVNGALVATNGGMTISPAAVGTKYNYLGKSQWPDPLLAGQLEDVFFAGYALTDDQVAAMAQAP